MYIYDKSTHHCVSPHKEGVLGCRAQLTICIVVWSIIGLVRVTNNKQVVIRKKVITKFSCDVSNGTCPQTATVNITICAKGVDGRELHVRLPEISQIYTMW